MSFSVTEAFVQQFGDNVILLSQQRGSVLSPNVRVKDGVVGKRTAFERIAATSMQKRTSRHADTPLISSTHSRRWANMEEHDWADLIDNVDEVKLLISLESPYAQNAAWAAGRTRDDIIITALLGTAVTGEEAGGTATLPAGQKVAAAASGLTLAKLRSAHKILNKNEILNEERFFVINAESLDDLLGDTTITSADFNSVRLLMDGSIKSFMGGQWLRSERLTNDGSSNRQNILYQKNGIGLAIAMSESPRVSERADKNYSTQVYLTLSIGSVRVEDEAVVEIAVVE
jgi:hypothetical protein